MTTERITAPFPQYAKSTAAEVLAAVREMDAHWQEFIAYARAESQRLTGEENNALYSGGRIEGGGIVAIRTTSQEVVDALPGRWKKPDRGGRSPFKNNPIWDEWNAHRHPRISVPGRRDIEWGESRMGSGALLEWQGVVYSGFGFLPRDPAPDGAELWEEIRASEWHRMAEDVRDAEGSTDERHSDA